MKSLKELIAEASDLRPREIALPAPDCMMWADIAGGAVVFEAVDIVDGEPVKITFRLKPHDAAKMGTAARTLAVMVMVNGGGDG